MDPLEIFKALANKSRLDILGWLKEPAIHFPEQAGKGFEDGVCVGHIQKKAGLTQSTVSEYLAVLQRAGLVISTRKGQWTYYKRKEDTLAAIIRILETKI